MKLQGNREGLVERAQRFNAQRDVLEKDGVLVMPVIGVVQP